MNCTVILWMLICPIVGKSFSRQSVTNLVFSKYKKNFPIRFQTEEWRQRNRQKIDEEEGGKGASRIPTEGFRVKPQRDREGTGASHFLLT